MQNLLDKKLLEVFHLMSKSEQALFLEIGEDFTQGRSGAKPALRLVPGAPFARAVSSGNPS